MEQATTRVAHLLTTHNIPIPSNTLVQNARASLLARKTASSTLTVLLDTAVVRGSFSNIPLWQALMEDVGMAVDLLRTNNGLFSPAPDIVAERQRAAAMAPLPTLPKRSVSGPRSEAQQASKLITEAKAEAQALEKGMAFRKGWVIPSPCRTVGCHTICN